MLHSFTLSEPKEDTYAEYLSELSSTDRLKPVLSGNRMEDILRLTEDVDYRKQLYKEYNISNI